MKRLSRPITAVVLSVLSFFPFPGAAYELTRGVVRDVIDGDTVVLEDGRHVRYIGVDTPETRFRQGREWIFSPEPHALAAKSRNSELVLKKEVRLEYDADAEDKYGRVLAYVFADGLMVNERLVFEGFGTVTIYPPNFKYAEKLISAQNAAIHAKAGLWEDVPSLSSYDAADSGGVFASVKGVIKGSHIRKNSIYLDFEAGPERGFSAVIWRSNLTFFREYGADPPECYVGRTVIVTGKIKNFGHSQMVLYHPSQISIVE